jgi:Mg2+ and Co2+ transporter CorA
VVAEWIDLVDPDAAELRKQMPKRLHARALDRLLAPAQHEDEPRPTLEGHGDYVFGVFLVPVAVPDENRVYYQEIDLVLTREMVLTVRKTPTAGEPSTRPARAVTSTTPGWSRTTSWTRWPSTTSI